jgi:hypothetical protein
MRIIFLLLEFYCRAFKIFKILSNLKIIKEFIGVLLTSGTGVLLSGIFKNNLNIGILLSVEFFYLWGSIVAIPNILMCNIWEFRLFLLGRILFG